ncbi:Radical SAM domain heme biosynthesis protein [Lachnospiraceae bacterium TWA4]|nr:Radical SAM domain heme biosynthesis protein [Lachnospiraceae bacterium TWA4]
MCYVRLTPKEVEAQGRIRTKDEWLEVAQQMKDAGVLFLLLTGGEPLLYSEFKELFLELKNLGMILTINTNGTLINEEWADFFAKHKPRRVNITLYGSNEEAYDKLCHYSKGFEQTIQAIKLLKARDIDVRIGCSITKANKNDIEGIVKIGEELDVPVRMDTYMMPATREREKEYKYQSRLLPEDAAKARIKALRYEMGEELFSEYRNRKLWEVENILPETEPKHMSCLAGNCSFTINWQGEIRPCVIMSEPALSVFDYGFEKAWKYIVEETDKIILNSKCNLCNLRPVCRTCAACALLEAGSYDAVPEYMCRFAKESLNQLKLQE